MIIEPIIYILAAIGALTLAGLFGAVTLALWVHFEAKREKGARLPPLKEPVSTKTGMGRWEVHIPQNGKMAHVRWSIPDSDGNYLMAAHYENTNWGRHACDSIAERWNKSGKLPVLRHACGEILWPLEQSAAEGENNGH